MWGDDPLLYECQGSVDLTPRAEEPSHPMIQATEADIVRFMSLVEKLPNGCWFWSGARSRGKGNKKWYGTFNIKVDGKRKGVRAHRFSCEVLGKRPCPPEHHRDHTCEFSLCVNPDHVEVVHRTVNQERKVARRRAREETQC